METLQSAPWLAWRRWHRGLLGAGTVQFLTDYLAGFGCFDLRPVSFSTIAIHAAGPPFS